MILEIRFSELRYKSDFEMNSNLIKILTKANAFYSHYRPKALHQYENKCMAA
jgi:hypothetical protein